MGGPGITTQALDSYGIYASNTPVVMYFTRDGDRWYPDADDTPASVAAQEAIFTWAPRLVDPHLCGGHLKRAVMWAELRGLVGELLPAPRRLVEKLRVPAKQRAWLQLVRQGL